MLQEGRRKLPQIAIALHHQGKHRTGVAVQPLLRLLELGLQALRRNLLKHGGPHRLRQDLLVEEGPPNGVEALQGGSQHMAMAFDRLVQLPLGTPIRGGDQLVIHLYELIEGLVVRLHKEADQHSRALGRLEEAEALGTGLRRVPGEGFLQIVVEPREVEGEYARSLDAIQLGGEVTHRLWGRHTRRGLEHVERREAMASLDVQQGIETGGQGRW
jgi:hypothetical protein